MSRLRHGLLGRQESCDEEFDFGGDTVFDQSGADGAALGGKVLRVGERDGGDDGLGLPRGGGEVAMEGVGVAVLRDGQGPDQVVKVSCAGLTPWL